MLYHIVGNTYYISGTTNCGIYVLNEDKEVALIDTGFAKEGPVIAKILKENNFKLKYILNTHAHADHIGANKYLMNLTGAKMITSQIERAFARNSKLDLGMLYGGYPLDNFNTSLMHIDEYDEILHLSRLPEGIKAFRLPGHHYDMVGFKTLDDVYFVADAIGNKETINHEHILLIYDVEGYLKSLDFIRSLEGKIVVPSHSEVTSHIEPLVLLNLQKISEIIDVILNILKEEMTLEDLVVKICDYYHIKLSYNKYLLITSTMRSYLAYLCHKGLAINEIKDNKLYYKKFS